jgi:hypothetical protein
VRAPAGPASFTPASLFAGIERDRAGSLRVWQGNTPYSASFDSTNIFGLAMHDSSLTVTADSLLRENHSTRESIETAKRTIADARRILREIRPLIQSTRATLAKSQRGLNNAQPPAVEIGTHPR